MKFRLLAFLSLGLAFTLPSTAHAGKGKGGGGEDGEMPAHRIFKRFDTNGNGVIDPGAESDALRAAFAKNPKLKYLDTNNDGKLDDSEIAAIKAKHGHKKKKDDTSA